jgi:hypothetical protein
MGCDKAFPLRFNCHDAGIEKIKFLHIKPFFDLYSMNYVFLPDITYAVVINVKYSSLINISIYSCAKIYKLDI